MIEMTVQEMISCVPALKEIREKKMPAKTAYQFARIIRELDKELQNFQDTRNGLIERYGKKDDNGKLIEDDEGNYTIFPDKEDIFKAEVDGLMKSKIHINCEQIKLEEINENDFTPAEIGELFLFIKE